MERLPPGRETFPDHPRPSSVPLPCTRSSFCFFTGGGSARPARPRSPAAPPGQVRTGHGSWVTALPRPTIGPYTERSPAKEPTAPMSEQRIIRPTPISGFSAWTPRVRSVELRWLDHIRRGFERYGRSSVETSPEESYYDLLSTCTSLL